MADVVYKFMKKKITIWKFFSIFSPPPPPPTGGLTPFNAYIALLWSSGHDTMLLLQDFDEILFQQPPCNILEAEDERLEKQNKVTCTRWEKFQLQGCSMDSKEGI